MGSTLGPEPQVSSHVRTRPLTSCETRGRLTSHSVCSLQEGTRAGSATQDSAGLEEIVGGKALPRGRS